MKKKKGKSYLNFNVIAAIALAGVVGLTVYTAQQPQNLEQEAKGNRGGNKGWSGRDHRPTKPAPTVHASPTQAPLCSTISCSTCQLQGKKALCLDREKGTAYCGDAAPGPEGTTCVSCPVPVPQ